MSGNVIQGPFYNSGFYDTGAGGGGSGGIPEGYKECQYMECVQPGHAVQDAAANDLQSDDYILISAFVKSGSTEWYNNIDLIGYYFGSTRNVSLKQNGSQTVVNGFANQVSINTAPNFIVVKKKGPYLDINGTSINNDTYNGTPTKISWIFSVTGNAFIGSKLFYLKIYSNDGETFKHYFIPVKNPSNQDCILDVITGNVYLLNTSNFRNGPVL